LSYAAFLVAFVCGVLFLVQERQLKHKHIGVLFHRLPSLMALDRANMLAIATGFALLTAGLAFGLIGSKLLLGRWWIPDPKTYMATGLWTAYLVLWVMRMRSTLRGRRVALLSILGFGLVLFTMLEASYLMHSAHPYL
jgi:ABC-type transport system involved in cytochrome c biogenesis permease subunit